METQPTNPLQLWAQPPDLYQFWLQGVLSRPEDDQPRLGMALFLRSLPDPVKKARGDLILAQLQGEPVARVKELIERAQCVLPEVDATWVRGFIDEIRCPLYVFTSCAQQLFREHPINKVSITDRQPRPAKLDSSGVEWVVRPKGPKGDEWMFLDAGSPSIPVKLAEHLPEARLVTWSPKEQRNIWHYATAEEAKEALSAACLACGRSLRG